MAKRVTRSRVSTSQSFPRVLQNSGCRPDILRPQPSGSESPNVLALGLSRVECVSLTLRSLIAAMLDFEGSTRRSHVLLVDEIGH